jgi:UDP-2,3-diacylglucosamine pyrophosphatase LpxH
MIVVLSDLHFGDKKASLEVKETVDQLINELQELGGIDEIILLGDIFDFWATSPYNAIQGSHYFFESVSKLNAKIVYVIGNHDHHIMIMYQERVIMDGIMTKTLAETGFSSEHIYHNGFLRGLFQCECPLEIWYPEYQVEVEHKHILLMHGHHLSELQTIVPRVLIGLRRGILKSLLRLGPRYTDEELEANMTRAYENLYLSAGKDFKGIANPIKTLNETITKKRRPVEQDYLHIIDFLEDHDKKDVSCFIYGHTHKPGVYRKESHELFVVNTGCWLKEPFSEWKSDSKEFPNTYLVIDDHLTLKRLGGEIIAGPIPIKELP